ERRPHRADHPVRRRRRRQEPQHARQPRPARQGQRGLGARAQGSQLRAVIKEEHMRFVSIASLLALASCSGSQAGSSPGGAIGDLMRGRGLTEADVSAALKTYTPTGKHDDYYVFASGGHSGQVVVIGVPSMRILKYIAVFTPEPWQGYGYGDEGSKT